MRQAHHAQEDGEAEGVGKVALVLMRIEWHRHGLGSESVRNTVVFNIRVVCKDFIILWLNAQHTCFPSCVVII